MYLVDKLIKAAWPLSLPCKRVLVWSKIGYNEFSKKRQPLRAIIFHSKLHPLFRVIKGLHSYQNACTPVSSKRIITGCVMWQVLYKKNTKLNIKTFMVYCRTVVLACSSSSLGISHKLATGCTSSEGHLRFVTSHLWIPTALTGHKHSGCFTLICLQQLFWCHLQEASDTVFRLYHGGTVHILIQTLDMQQKWSSVRRLVLSIVRVI